MSRIYLILHNTEKLLCFDKILNGNLNFWSVINCLCNGAWNSLYLLEHFFFSVGQTNFRNKIPRLLLPTILFIAPKRPSSLGKYVSAYETDIKRISRNRVQIFSCFLPLSLSTFMLDNEVVKNRCNYLKKIVF